MYKYVYNCSCSRKHRRMVDASILAFTILGYIIVIVLLVVTSGMLAPSCGPG